MKTITKWMLLVMTVFVMAGLNSCSKGGDDDNGGGGGGNFGKSSVGAWYYQSGKYVLLWDFADGGTVTLHGYEISGDVYYKTMATGTYTKSDNVLTLNIAGDKATATIVDDVMHMDDPDLGAIQLKKLSGSMQTTISTMEAYFDSTQKEVVGEWGMIDKPYAAIITFDATGTGSMMFYAHETRTDTDFKWTRGNNIRLSSDLAGDFSLKFNVKGDVLTIVETYTGSSTPSTYEEHYQRMTPELRAEIEEYINPSSVTIQGSYVRQDGVLGDKGYHVFSVYTSEESGDYIYWFTVDGNGRLSDPHYYDFTVDHTTITLTDQDSGTTYTGTVSRDGSTVTFNGITYVSKTSYTEVPSGSYIEEYREGKEYFSAYITPAVAIMTTHESGTDKNGDGRVTTADDVESVNTYYFWNGYDYVTLCDATWKTVDQLYFNYDGERLTVGEIVMVPTSTDMHPEALTLLAGSTPWSFKAWTWDDSVDGHFWGNMGYHGYSGAELGTEGKGTWWGAAGDDDFQAQAAHSGYATYVGDGNPKAYMTFGHEGKLQSNNKDNSYLRQGLFSISDFNNSDASAYYHGYLNTPEPAILWPYEINSYGNTPTRFEIAYLDGERMTLVYPDNGDFNGSTWTEATFWHFKHDAARDPSAAARPAIPAHIKQKMAIK